MSPAGRPRRSGAAGAAAGQDPLRVRRWILLGSFALALMLVLGRALQLQAVEGERWRAAAEGQHREQVPLPARRGAIYDRNGLPLALSHETFRVSVAPRELRDARAVRRRLVEVLGISEARARRATDRERAWVVLPGRYTAEQQRQLGGTRGLHFERRLERFYPQGDVAREVIGTVSADERALGGIEQQFDGLLRGTPGYSVLRRNARGDAQATVSLPVVPPTDGASVYLTLDFELQEIADVALRDAVRETGSAGGDLLLLDPATGEILAAVSRRGAEARSLSAITEPYEPGSTLKPFTAAALLAERRAALTDSVHAENGRWNNGLRTWHDSSPRGWISFADALQYSSNIALVKLGARLEPGEQYEYLRDFGFGTATGVEYPAESSGRLRRPDRWTAHSPGSLSVGYEISVTPLQLASAYGALANGGVLMEPYLLRRVEDAAGRVLEQRGARPVRRVVPEQVTRELTEVLVSVVAGGTATRASLARFAVAGKTGTARRTGADGRYQQGSYTSTFVGYFPARDPQLVILVKLDEPQGQFYGGLTAAPVSRETLQGILAARSSALDPRALLGTAADADALGGAAASPAALAPLRALEGTEGTYVFSLQGAAGTLAAGPAPEVVVPDLAGMALREAARRAHALGLAVRVQSGGRIAETRPAAGEPLQRGDTLLLIGRGP